MERSSDIISVLHQGKQFTNELRKLNPNSKETYGVLLEKILSCYDSALEMVLIGNGPNSNESSPGSEGFDSCTKNVSKKRKTMASKRIHVCTRTLLGGQLDDGHSWRKYGQKNILGTAHPRAYYRCTHRNTQGCLATKLIQRTNEDSKIFEVVYKGQHSCIPERQGQMNAQSLSIKMFEEKEEKCSVKNEQGLEAESTKELDSTEVQEFPLVFFPSVPFECETLEALYFPETRTSPMSGSPYSCLWQSSELDFSDDIISNPTLVTDDFQIGELDFLLDQEDFDSQSLTDSPTAVVSTC